MQVFILPVAQIPWRIWVEFFTTWAAVGLTWSWCSDGSMHMTGHLNKMRWFRSPGLQTFSPFCWYKYSSSLCFKLFIFVHCEYFMPEIVKITSVLLVRNYSWLLPLERSSIFLIATKSSLSHILPDSVPVWVPFKGFCVGLSPPPPIYQKINACWQLSVTATSVFLTAFPVCPAHQSVWDNGYSCRG